MSLVTVGDLKAYMDVSFSDVEERAAQIVIDGLHAELEAYLRRPVEVRTFRESHVVPETYVPYGLGAPFFDFGSDENASITGDYPDVSLETYIMYVEHSPIVSVDTVDVVQPGDTLANRLEEGNDYVVRKFGIEFYGTVSASSTINVVYKAGIDGADVSYFKVVILRAAARETQNMHDDVVGIKALETRNVAPLETGFSDSELRLLKRWRRQRI